MIGGLATGYIMMTIGIVGCVIAIFKSYHNVSVDTEHPIVPMQ